VSRERPAGITWLLTGQEDYGVRRTTLGFLGELRRRGIRTTAIVLSGGSMVTDLEEGGHEVVTFDDAEAPPRFGGNVLRKLLNGARMLRYQSRWTGRIAAAASAAGSDVLHVRWPYLVGLAGAAAREAGIRAVWQMPNTVGTTLPFGLNRRYLSALCRRLGITPIANSRYTATTLATGGRLPVHAHLGVDPAVFDPARYAPASRAEMGIPTDATVLAIFARLQPSKGQARLIRAVAELADVRPPLHLVIAGGPYPGAPTHAGELRELASELSVDDRAHFVGRVAEPQPYYLAADIVVSSTVDAEPFGLSVIEAMMMGRPVLAHALGGPAETVLDGRTGWHVPGATASDFTDGIRRALSDRGRWPEMRRAARDHAVSEFSIAAAVDRYLAILAATEPGGAPR